MQAASKELMLAEIILKGAGMDLTLHLVYDRIQVLLVLQLQFLVMGPTLVGRPSLEDLRKSIEDLRLSSGCF